MLMVLKFFSLALQLCVIRLIYVNSVNSVNMSEHKLKRKGNNKYVLDILTKTQKLGRIDRG